MSIIEERQKDRWAMLHKYWEITGGHGDYMIVDMWDVGKQLDWDREKTHLTFDYLKGEGLLKPMTLGGGSTITHRGVKEVETTLAGKSTEHFQPNIVFVSGGNIGNLAVGTGGAVHQVSFQSLGDAVSELERLLREVADPLPEGAAALIEEARRPETSRAQLATAIEKTADLGPAWSAKLKEFALGAASGGAGGILTEGIKWVLGL